MSLSPGDVVPLAIEKAVAGGWMLARHAGQVVLVGGAIPGERVSARVERVRKGLAYARAMTIEQASRARREPGGDPLCGGCLYAHVAYPEQLVLKAAVISDAFERIGRIPLRAPVAVASSPEEGYRMRARLHIRDGRAGFFREGTHEVCDARATRQLSPATCDVVDRVAAGLRALHLHAIRGLEISENSEGSERVVHLEAASPVESRSLANLADGDGLTGLTLGRPGASEGPPSSGPAGDIAAAQTVQGSPYVADVVSIGDAAFTLRRHVLSFFQGNRYLLGDLVAHVTSQAAPSARVVDLYAGVGLFALACAVARGATVQAVEGDRIAALDLDANARAAAGASIETFHGPVEALVKRVGRAPDLLIVDPPRSGLSPAALDGATALRARRIVYVSCDAATLARDARRLIDARYSLDRLDAFDLFPNTPHVETVAVFSSAP
jgi:23S rRNA (uracil1939-C5)-methyltransferase